MWYRIPNSNPSVSFQVGPAHCYVPIRNVRLFNVFMNIQPRSCSQAPGRARPCNRHCGRLARHRENVAGRETHENVTKWNIHATIPPRTGIKGTRLSRDRSMSRDIGWFTRDLARIVTTIYTVIAAVTQTVSADDDWTTGSNIVRTRSVHQRLNV